MKVKDSSGITKKLLETSTVLRRRKKDLSVLSGDLTASDFSMVFHDKVEHVRSSTLSAPIPAFDDDRCSSSLDQFCPYNITTIRWLILHALNKNCEPDLAPTWIVRQFVDQIAPFVTLLCNVSFPLHFPFKSNMTNSHTCSEKSNLEPHIQTNYRLTSNVSLLLKLLERCVNLQLNAYLLHNNIIPDEQLQFSPSSNFHHHSATDRVIITLIIMLDLSLAFNTVKDPILFRGLQHRFSLTGTIHQRFVSHPSSKSQWVVSTI